MTETDAEYDTAIRQARDNVFVDPARIDEIDEKVASGVVSRREGIKWLLALDRGVQLGSLDISQRQVDTEWVALLNAMDEEGKAWQQIARAQFRQGYYLLPISVLTVLAATILAAHSLGVAATIITPLAAGCLATLAAHSFFVFRVHQQARLAAERLSEKRAAILFLRLAVGRGSPEESAQILSAGTSMFLGHHAAEAIPLNSNDFPRK